MTESGINAVNYRVSCICCILAAALCAACSARDDLQRTEPEPRFDPTVAPPENRIAPPGAIPLAGALDRPVTAARLAGNWRLAAQACTIAIRPGALDGAGPARVRGDCPAPLKSVSAWQVDAPERVRITFLDSRGEAVWTGLMTGPDRLTGFLAGGERLALARS